MQIIDQEAHLIFPQTANQALVEMKQIEYAGRNCYNSQNKITDDSYDKFIRNMIQNCHETPLEFGSLFFELITSRAVLAEITRHRLANFCVLSQRYVKMNVEGGEKGIKFIRPEWANISDETLNNKSSPEAIWVTSMNDIEKIYDILLETEGKAERAREVLPNSTYCKICMKANVREWRHIFVLRCAKAAYPQMRELAKEMLIKAYRMMPPCFEDLYNEFIDERKDVSHEQGNARRQSH